MSFLSKGSKKQVAGKNGKIYKSVSFAAIVGIFVTVAILVLGIAKIITINSTVFGIIATIAILCAGALMTLPWIKVYEKYGMKKTSIVFLSLISICTVLWIICCWLGIEIFNQAKSAAGTSISDHQIAMNFIRATLILTVQFIVASAIGTCVIKYRKSVIAFQVIAYASYLYVDFYLTFALVCLNITSDGLDVSKNIGVLGNKFVLTFFAIAVLYVFIANLIIKKSESQKVKNIVSDMIQEEKIEQKVDEVPAAEVSQKPVETPAEKLEKLKELLDKNLITKEEYDEKRAEIIKDL
jgi:hypothetical protein